NEHLTQSSSYTLNKVRNALDVRFPNTGIRVSCPAITVPFGTTRSEVTEVVPAEYMRETGGYKVYDIADSANGCSKATQDAHNASAANIDAKLAGLVKPLIRFVKAWKYFREVPISSFYLELRTAQYAANEKSIIYSWDVKRVLCLLRDIELASMQDP